MLSLHFPPTKPLHLHVFEFSSATIFYKITRLSSKLPSVSRNPSLAHSHGAVNFSGLWFIGQQVSKQPWFFHSRGLRLTDVAPEPTLSENFSKMQRGFENVTYNTNNLPWLSSALLVLKGNGETVIYR